jgi:hypothetical protein
VTDKVQGLTAVPVAMWEGGSKRWKMTSKREVGKAK